MAATALAAVAATAYLIKSWLDETLDIPLIVYEGGVLEVIHSVFAGVAAVLFYFSWRDGRGAAKVAGGVLTLLAAAAFVREIDIKHIVEVTGPHWLYVMADHGLQEALLILMTLPIAFYLYRHRAFFADVVRMALAWRAWPLYLAGFFIVLGVYFDDRVVTSMRMRFWEELIETYGYGFMVMAAWRHWNLAKESAAESETVA